MKEQPAPLSDLRQRPTSEKESSPPVTAVSPSAITITPLATDIFAINAPCDAEVDVRALHAEAAIGPAHASGADEGRQRVIVMRDLNQRRDRAGIKRSGMLEIGDGGGGDLAVETEGGLRVARGQAGRLAPKGGDDALRVDPDERRVGTGKHRTAQAILEPEKRGDARLEFRRAIDRRAAREGHRLGVV